MIVVDFENKYLMYDNYAIWEITSLEEFFKSHEMMFEIFEKEYGVSYNERNNSDVKIADSEIVVVSKLLDYFEDKHFFVFSNNDSNHQGLKNLQDKKIISFGMDIYVLNPKKIYVLEMDKTKDPKMYDN